jgi:26S proteasome regulatory subunit N9
MDPEVISNFLAEQREAAPEDLQQEFLNIEDFWDRKLWHQLTDVLSGYFSNPASAPQRLLLFRRFILSFAEKISQLKFVSLGLSAATQCSGVLPSAETVPSRC